MNDLFRWVSEDDEIALNYMCAIDRPETKTDLLIDQSVDPVPAGTEWSFSCDEKQPHDPEEEEGARVEHRFFRDGWGQRA